jgi:mono/diheme cytochrome c family protein
LSWWFLLLSWLPAWRRRATDAADAKAEPKLGRRPAGCHGANAEGNVGPKLAGTALSFDQVKNTVRNGKGTAMPKFSADQISDKALTDIYAWLKSM